MCCLDKSGINAGIRERAGNADLEVVGILAHCKNFAQLLAPGRVGLIHDAEQLWETTMDPAARRLTRVHIEDAADVEHLVTVLMGDKVQSRKEYIFSYADFNKDKTAFEKLRERQ